MSAADFTARGLALALRSQVAEKADMTDLSSRASNRVTARDAGADANGSSDCAGALNAGYLGTARELFLETGNYRLDTPITASYLNSKRMAGQEMYTTRLVAGAVDKPVISLTNYSHLTGKNYFLAFHDFLLEGHVGGEGTSVLAYFGNLDFCTFNRVCVEGEKGGAGSWLVDGSICLASRWHDCWSFNAKGWAWEIRPRQISDLRWTGCRAEGNNTPGSYAGWLISNSPRRRDGTAHTVQTMELATPLTICNGKVERLRGPGVYVEQSGGGVHINAMQFGYSGVYLGHRCSGARVKHNTFLDVFPSVIDAGYDNDCTENQYLKGAGLPLLTNKRGYNSIIPRADMVDAVGADGWTFSGVYPASYRSYGRYGALRANPIVVSGGGNASLTHAVTANTFYVLRAAYSGSPTAVTANGGCRILVHAGADTGGTVLFDSGLLIDGHLERGQIAANHWVFKVPAGTTQVTIEVVSVTGDTLFLYLCDTARNMLQNNPSLEESWSASLPGSGWSAGSSMTVSTYQAESHSGSQCLRLQMPTSLTSTNELRTNGFSPTVGQAYEVGYWTKDLNPGAGFDAFLMGMSSIDSDGGGPGRPIAFHDGLDGWTRVVWQFVHYAGGGQMIPARASTGGRIRDMDRLFDDFYVVPITL